MPDDLYLPLYLHCHHQDSVTNQTFTPFTSQICPPHTNSNHPSYQLFHSQVISKCALWPRGNFLSSFIPFLSVYRWCLNVFLSRSNRIHKQPHKRYLTTIFNFQKYSSFLKTPGFPLPCRLCVRYFHCWYFPKFFSWLIHTHSLRLNCLLRMFAQSSCALPSLSPCWDKHPPSVLPLWCSVTALFRVLITVY